jgi:hypothetical protein
LPRPTSPAIYWDWEALAASSKGGGTLGRPCCNRVDLDGIVDLAGGVVGSLWEVGVGRADDGWFE